MAAQARRHRDDGEEAGSLLTVLTLNTARRADLGGLAALVKTLSLLRKTRVTRPNWLKCSLMAA